MELPPEPPDAVLRELSAAGAQVLSLNPVRDTLGVVLRPARGRDRRPRHRAAMNLATVRAVALAVFKESVRDRVPYSMVLFSVVLMAAAILMSRLTASQDLKVIKDLGLATMNVMGLLIALFIGTGLVAKEVERRSIYSVLSKPVTRTAFLLGKFFGLVLTLAVNLAMMTVAFYVMLLYQDLTSIDWVQQGWRAPALDLRLLLPIGLTLLQLTLVTAVALFFSTFSSPLLATLFTLGIWVAGHFSADLRDFGAAVDCAGGGRRRQGRLLRAAQPLGPRREEPGRPRAGGGVAGARPGDGVDARHTWHWCSPRPARSSPAGTSSRPWRRPPMPPVPPRRGCSSA